MTSVGGGSVPPLGDNVQSQYSHFTISSPDCALHTALAHMINELEIVESHMPYIIGIHVRLHLSNALITSDCNVQSGLEIVK